MYGAAIRIALEKIRLESLDMEFLSTTKFYKVKMIIASISLLSALSLFIYGMTGTSERLTSSEFRK